VVALIAALSLVAAGFGLFSVGVVLALLLPADRGPAVAVLATPVLAAVIATAWFLLSRRSQQLPHPRVTTLMGALLAGVTGYGLFWVGVLLFWLMPDHRPTAVATGTTPALAAILTGWILVSRRRQQQRRPRP